MIKNCEMCGEEYSADESKQRFCSPKCWQKSRPINKIKRSCENCGTIIMVWPNSIRKYCSQRCAGEAERTKIVRRCETCGQVFRVWPNIIAKGRGKYCSKRCYGMALRCRTGKDSPRWQGGITPKNKRIRNNKEYKSWRDEVYARDNWTCSDCGHRGGELHVHHILPFADFPEYRFDIPNGITLCKPCHSEIHTGN